MTETSRLETIRQRAYAIWESAGRPHGQDFAHWLQAEAEMAEQQPQPASPRRPRSKPAARRPSAVKRA